LPPTLDARQRVAATALPPVRSLGPLGVAAWPAERLDLSLGALARLAQNEEPGGPGGEVGSGGGLGALTAPVGAFSAASHKTSTLRSPAFASSMIFLAIISSVRSAGRLTAARAVSKATPTRRVVSGSKFWPFKKGLMVTRASPSRQAEPKLANFTLSAVKPKSELNRPSKPGTESMFWYFVSSMRREG